MGLVEVLCAGYCPLFIYLYIMGSTYTSEHYTSMKFHTSCLNSVEYILIHMMFIENFKRLLRSRALYCDMWLFACVLLHHSL